MTWRGGRVVCRPGRGEQQLKNRPVRETGWAITGAQSGFEPLPRHCRDTGCWGKQMWAGARLPACWAGAQSQSRLAGCTGHTSAAEVLTCRDEEASICYLSGEFLIPLQWLTTGEPASPGSGKVAPAPVPSLSLQSSKGPKQDAARPSGLGRMCSRKPPRQVGSEWEPGLPSTVLRPSAT